MNSIWKWYFVQDLLTQKYQILELNADFELTLQFKLRRFFGEWNKIALFAPLYEAKMQSFEHSCALDLTNPLLHEAEMTVLQST